MCLEEQGGFEVGGFEARTGHFDRDTVVNAPEESVFVPSYWDVFELGR